MAIELTEVASGYSTGVINDNFEAIEAYINDNLLNRDGTTAGEVNQLELDIDVNNHRLFNLPLPINSNEAARLIDVQNAVEGDTQANLISFTPTAPYTSDTVQGAIEAVQFVDTPTGTDQPLAEALDSRVIYVDTIADLQALPGGNLMDGQQVQVREYNAGTGVGGGLFYWDSDSDHLDNGGTVIEITDSSTGRMKRLTGSAPEAFGVNDQVTLTVGSGGHYESINDALFDLSRLDVKYTEFLPDTGFPEPVAILNLLSGFKLEEAVFFSGDHLGWIEITSEDSTVFIDEGLAQYRSGGSYFTGYHNAVLPIIGCLFEVESGGPGGMFGITLSRGSYSFVRPGCGIKNCSRRAVQLSFGSTFIGQESIFSGCSDDVCARVANLCKAHLRGADLTNSSGDGIAANDSSLVEAVDCDVSGAGNDGIRAANGAMINFDGGTASNCGRYGIRVAGTGFIEAEGATATGNSTADIILDGGTIDAQGATFGTYVINTGILYLGGEGASGENSNGKFTKHLDGTMTCTVETTIDMTDGATFTLPFPENFSSAPSTWFMSGNSSATATADGHASLYGGRGLSSSLRPEPQYTTQWAFQRTEDPAAPTAVPVTLFAFGEFRD